MMYKELMCIPADGEEFPEPAVILENAKSGLVISVGEQYVHSLVPQDFVPRGTLLWETGMDQALSPEASPPHRFAGWSD